MPVGGELLEFTFSDRLGSFPDEWPCGRERKAVQDIKTLLPLQLLLLFVLVVLLLFIFIIFYSILSICSFAKITHGALHI